MKIDVLNDGDSSVVEEYENCLVGLTEPQKRLGIQYNK